MSPLVDLQPPPGVPPPPAAFVVTNQNTFHSLVCHYFFTRKFKETHRGFNGRVNVFLSVVAIFAGYAAERDITVGALVLVTRVHLLVGSQLLLAAVSTPALWKWTQKWIH